MQRSFDLTERQRQICNFDSAAGSPAEGAEHVCLHDGVDLPHTLLALADDRLVAAGGGPGSCCLLRRMEWWGCEL